MNELRQLKDCGFEIEGAKKVLDYNKLAMDASLMITNNNFGVPQEFSTFLDPTIIDILQAPKNAKLCYSEVKKGDWASTIEKFRVNDFTGQTQAYSDYNNNGSINPNYNWEFRENYVFQTVMRYGDLETETSSLAKINLASDKQKTAAKIIEQDANKFYIYGVAGKVIYGMMNDPNLNSAIVAEAGISASAFWSKKTTKEIFKDIQDLFKQLQTQLSGNASMTDKIKLFMPPLSETYLLTATDFNVSVIDMIKKAFPNLEIILLPEYATASGNLMQMVIDDIISQPTAQLGFSEKFKGTRIIPELSSYKQKFLAGTYGFIGFRPAAIAQMTGF